ncbi:MAG: hypothetical protein IJW15_03110 [Clostridia bacterium]|nr:hypothetical protein [Clostridia bacterium]
MNKKCILYDRDCIACGECDMCDIDPKKKCDNCGACLEMDDDYKTVDVDLTLEETNDPEMLSFEELFPDEAFGGDRNWKDDDDEDFGDYEDDGNDDLRDDFGELF